MVQKCSSRIKCRMQAFKTYLEKTPRTYPNDAKRLPPFFSRNCYVACNRARPVALLLFAHSLSFEVGKRRASMLVPPITAPQLCGYAGIPGRKTLAFQQIIDRLYPPITVHRLSVFQLPEVEKVWR